MQYAPISYEDMSHLNAQWQEERPAVAGLGEPPGFGRHSYVDVSFLNARLRPILPATVGLSPDGMGGGSLSGNSLGADDTGFTTDQIKLAQDLMNGALIQNGYQPIQADGKLGPATCGAIQWYQANIDASGGASFAGACSSVKSIPPTKVGSSTGVRTGTTPGMPRSTTPAPASMLSGGGSNWMLIGSAVAAIAVGGALIYRASKRK